VTVGGGGAYLNHHYYSQQPSGAFVNVSALGAQFVVSSDYALTRSGRLRVGVTGRYYYVDTNSESTARIFTIGPEFTFSFR
jgi:hypothetical protein